MVYIASVWDPKSQASIDTQQAVQKRAARFVHHHNSKKRSRIATMLQSLTWQCLQMRRQNIRVALMVNCANNNSALCLTNAVRWFVRKLDKCIQNVYQTDSYTHTNFLNTIKD